MKLDSATSIFNMGDTSIRVRQVVEVNRVILRELDHFMKDSPGWKGNGPAQEEFYRNFIQAIVQMEEEDGMELFRDFARSRTYQKPEQGKVGMRGRTLTNALVKTGLVDSRRQISPVGRAYLTGGLAEADPLEQALGLSPDNLVYLRQYLKLRIYDHEGAAYFYNFRFGLMFLAAYENVPQGHFLKILESVKPGQDQEEILAAVRGYRDVAEGRKSFEDYYTETFSPTLRSRQELLLVRRMFEERDFSQENFIRFFSNRDSRETSLLYREFVLALIRLTEHPSQEALDRVWELSRKDKIKKAFSQNRLPFVFEKKESPEHFLEANQTSPLLHPDHYHIYLEFIFSKHNDLVREYSDMCRRTFQNTGLFRFENGLANLNCRWLIRPLLELLGEDFALQGRDSWEAYEDTLDSPWFQNNTMAEILGAGPQLIQELFARISRDFGAADMAGISRLILSRREQEYREFVERQFPREKVGKILEMIRQRRDEEVFRMVTDNATIPTIYEYILTIAWYHLSEKKDYMLHQSFQVSLDGSRLPLSHRGGGAGDIEVVTGDYALLLEATLMDMNNQKRGELEPVIRHSVNFVLDHSDLPAQTLFIANELDANVLNIFRAMEFVQLFGTSRPGRIEGLNIFALTTMEVASLLAKNVTDQEILRAVNSQQNQQPVRVCQGWRKPVLELLGL